MPQAQWWARRLLEQLHQEEQQGLIPWPLTSEEHQQQEIVQPMRLGPPEGGRQEHRTQTQKGL